MASEDGDEDDDGNVALAPTAAADDMDAAAAIPGDAGKPMCIPLALSMLPPGPLLLNDEACWRRLLCCAVKLDDREAWPRECCECCESSNIMSACEDDGA